MDDYSSAAPPPIPGAESWWPFLMGVAPFIIMAITGIWGAYLAIKNNKLEKDKIDAEDARIKADAEKAQYIEKLKAETERYSNQIKADTELAVKEYEERSKQQTQDYARWNEFQNDLIKETKELREECKALRESLRQALDNIAERDKQIKELRSELIDRDKKIVEMTAEIEKLKHEVTAMQAEIKELEKNKTNNKE